MDKVPSPQTVETPLSWLHITGAPSDDAPPSEVEKSEQQSPPAKRRKEDKERTRVSRACDRCKKKKTRCTGRYPCPLCLRSGLSCEFTAAYTRGRLPSVIVDEAAMTEATRPKISTPQETSSASRTPSVHTTTSSLLLPLFVSSSNPLTLDRSAGNDASVEVERLQVPSEDPTRDPPSRTSPEPSQTDQQGHYIGPASGVSFLIRIQKALHQNSSLSHDSSIFTFGDAPLPEFDPTFFVLPPKSDAQRLVERYFDFAAPTHRFLHRPTIEKLLNEFYDTQGDMRNKEDAAAKTALLLIVFAQAQTVMPSGLTSQDNSARYYFASEHQLAKERGAVRLTSVQARLGQCFYLLTQSRINHCWSLFGTTAHLVFAIGLNRGRSHDCTTSTIDYVENESRRRVFWSAYILDKYLAAALGRPRTFKDEDIDQELPTVVNDDELHTLSINPSNFPRSQSIMLAPVEHIRLSRILSCVLRDLYPIRPPSMSLRVELAAKYQKDLRDWRAGLSRFLDAEGFDSSLLIPLYQRQRNVLNLAYFHAVLLVHRPFLLSNFASLAHIDARPGHISNIDTTENINTCLEAAMGTVRIVDEIFQSSQIFRAFWFTQYYAFCAVVVLYIYRIQQHLVSPGKCEGYLAAGQRCQAQLASLSGTDCLSKRYTLVLEELRLEAVKQCKTPAGTVASSSAGADSAFNATGLANTEFTTAPLSANLSLSTSTPQSNSETANFNSYYGNISTPESSIFTSNFVPTSSIIADLTSWGQFDSLVTAGIGVLDGGGGYGAGFNSGQSDMGFNSLLKF